MREYPEVKLRVYGHDAFHDLAFLRFFPTVLKFQADCWSLGDWSGLEYLRDDAVYIGLGATKRTLSLSLLRRFASLKQLFIEGHDKDISVLTQLEELEDVTLRSITLPDLTLLTSLPKLWSLDIKLGGTKDLAMLPELRSLKYLELWMVRGLRDLEPIASLTSLQSLFLQALVRIEVLPSLHALAVLRRAVVISMKNFRDLQPIADAPALEEFAAWEMSHLSVDAFRCFLGHPTLKYLGAGLGSARKNDAVRLMFPGLAHGSLPRFVYS